MFSSHKIFFLTTFLTSLLSFHSSQALAQCLTGAFIADRPTKQDIINFRNSYGKKPFLVMVFVDWGNYIEKRVIRDVYSQGCVLFVTWEPWNGEKREGIDYEGLLEGKYDNYIKSFANRLKKIGKEVFLRLGHEMNGNWYPWAGTKIGKDKFIAIYKYVKDIFDKEKATNVKWVFSINWEDIPRENNHFISYYPGDEYTDFVGVDGYNWGDTQAWSRWMSFEDIFDKRYEEIANRLKKPVIITEFSSSSSGGKKALWIKEAMEYIKKMQNIKAFVLFNVDKEADWSFQITDSSGKELKKQLENGHFKDYNIGDD